MALFGRKKAALDYPPQNSAEEQVEAHNDNEGSEPIFRPKPEELDISTLVEKARAGEAINVVPELNDFFDGWVHYAQDRNIFVGSESINALAQARREAIDLAARKDFEGLQAKLGELAGPVAAQVEAAADANIRHIQESKEATPKENKEALASAVSETQELLLDQPYIPGASQAIPGRTMSERFANIAEQAQAERAALDAAEGAYLESFKEYHRTKGLVETVREKVTRKEPEELLKLKEAYNEARVAYANALEASVAKRLDERGLKWKVKNPTNGTFATSDTIPNAHVGAYHDYYADKKPNEHVKAYKDYHKDRYPEKYDKERVMRRYNVMIRYKAVVEPTAQKLYDARIEAMGEREKGLFWKGLEKFQRINTALEKKHGKHKARFFRAAVTTIVVGGGAAAIGAFGTAGALSILGLGVFRFGRALASSFVGAAAGEGAAQWYGNKRGKRKLEEAREDLARLAADRRHGESRLNVGELEDYDRTHLKLTKESDERTLEQKKMLIRALTALGVGGVVSGILAELPSASNIVEQGHGATHVSETHTKTAHVTSRTTSRPHTTHAAEAPVDKTNIESVSVHGNVNDADKLFGRFIDNARAQFPNLASAPPALRVLLEQYHHVDGMHQQDVLTRFLHLQNGGSVVVHPGDTLSYENGRVMFQGHTLIDEHGAVHNLHEEMLVDVEPVHPHIVPIAQHVEHPVTQEAAQSATQPVTTPSTLPQTAPVEAPQLPVEAPPVSAEHITPPAPEHVEQPMPPAPAPEHVVVQPAPAPVPEHVEQAASVAAPAPTPEHIVHVTPPVEHPIESHVPSNDNEPLAPSASVTENIPGVVHNSFGITVDTSHAHVYQLYQPENNPNVLVAFGGTVDDRVRFAVRFLSQPENAHKVVFVTSTTINPETGYPATVPWIVDAKTGQVIPDIEHTIVTDPTSGTPVPPPDANSLYKLIQ